MHTHKIRIAYVHNLRNTFTQVDEQILKARYHVQPLYFPSKHWRYVPQTWSALRDVDVVVAWFASWHSLPAFVFAAFRRIPRILITGGYDVANEPAINYGLRQGGVPRLLSDIVFRLTTLALPFSETAYQETLENTPLKPAKTRPLPLGVSDNEQYVLPCEKKRMAITVGGISAVSVRRKGIREFVQAAQYLPDVEFVVVGKHHDDTIDVLREIAAPNVTFTGFVADRDLSDLLRHSAVYVQPSHHEGFGLSVAESMLARCVPVISRRGSLPEVVGDIGIFLEQITPRDIAEKISYALDTQSTAGQRARERVLKHFSIERRAEGLYHAIETLVSQKEDSS